MRSSLAVVMFFGLAPAAADAPLPKELADVQGVWKLVAGESGGQPLDMSTGPYLWVIEGGKIKCAGADFGQFTLDATKKPKAIDLKLLTGNRALVGIYELDGDTLRVCMNSQNGANQRPTGLATLRQPTARLLFFQRVKGEQIDPVAGMRGYLGVSLSPADEDRLHVAIQSVLKDGPAEKAGLKVNDQLLKVNAVVIRTVEDVIEAMKDIKPTSAAALLVVRDGKEKVIEVKSGMYPFGLLD
jgi:uncharacterized protein (TIGR03067 family)